MSNRIKHVRLLDHGSIGSTILNTMINLKNILKKQVNKCKKLNIIEPTTVKTVQLDCNVTITKPTGELAGFRLNHMVKSEFCNISYKKATIPVPMTIKFIYNFQG